MRRWFMSLNGAVTLGILAFVTLIARLTFLDALYVPEFSAFLPESQPATIALTMLVYMVLVGGWVWALLAAAQGSRGGLIVSLLFSLLTAFGGGLFTLMTLCPNGCAAPPVGNGIVWANLISGLAASIALIFQLTRRQSPVVSRSMREETA
ncbi:MAG: hypothetical protein GC204_18695 [Chloroflexi bacterium]|nr:hypothetical protein [Chloroflexota bacterium]